MKIYFAGNITVPREKMLTRLGGNKDLCPTIIMEKGKNFLMNLLTGLNK